MSITFILIIFMLVYTWRNRSKLSRLDLFIGGILVGFATMLLLCSAFYIFNR